MIMRRVALIFCRVVTALASLMVSLYGVYQYAGSHMSLHAPLVDLYCLLPLLSFPVFLLSFWFRRPSVIAHWAMAMSYLIVYSMLNWRTCSELGYCIGVAATVAQTLATRPAELTFGVAILNLFTLLLKSKRLPAPR